MTSFPTAHAPDLDRTTAFSLALAAPESVGVIDTLGVNCPVFQAYLAGCNYMGLEPNPLETA